MRYERSRLEDWTPGWIVTCPGTPSYNDGWVHRPVFSQDEAYRIYVYSRIRHLPACPHADQHRVEQVLVHPNGERYIRRRHDDRSKHHVRAVA